MYKRYLIFPFAVLIAFSLLSACKKPSENKPGQGIVFEPNKPTESSQSALPGISIPGWKAIKLPAGKLGADVSLHNPDANAGYYDLSFTLKLADSEEVIFTTGSIPPGYKCSRVTLTRELEPGNYLATLFVQPYLQDEHQTPTNNAELEILLIVE